MADREALSKNICLSDVLRIQALFRGALVRKQLQDVKRSFEAVFHEIERTESEIVDLEKLISIPKVLKKPARKEIESRQKESVPHRDCETISKRKEINVNYENFIDDDKDSGRFNSVEVQTSFIDLKTEPFKVAEKLNDSSDHDNDNVLDDLDTSWKDRVIPFIQNQFPNDEDRGNVADELRLDLNSDRLTGRESNINSERCERLASCDRRSEHSGQDLKQEGSKRLEDFDRRSEHSVSEVHSNVQGSTPRSVRSDGSGRDINKEHGHHDNNRGQGHTRKSERSNEENVSVRSKKEVERLESEVDHERLSHRSEERSVRSDSGQNRERLDCGRRSPRNGRFDYEQRSERSDSGQRRERLDHSPRSGRSDSGQRNERPDSGQKSRRSDSGQRSARSDDGHRSGRTSGKRDDREVRNHRDYHTDENYETESGQGHRSSRSNSERSLRSERSNYVNERNSPCVQSGRSERSNKSEKSDRSEPHSEESRSRSKNRDRHSDVEPGADGSVTQRSDRLSESGQKTDRSGVSSRPRSAKSREEMMNEKMTEVMPPRSTSPAPPHTSHHGNRQQQQHLQDSTTLTNVTSVWDSFNSLPGSKSLIVTDSLPQDATSLKELRKNISMELLWVQQAIDSRKNYLNLKRKM